MLYELTAFALSGDAVAGIRNGADVLLKSLFLSLGGRHGLLAFNVLLIGAGAVIVWRDRRASRAPLEAGVFVRMAIESIVGALVFGLVAGVLTTLLLRGPGMLAVGPMDGLDLQTQLVISLGAGIYEELLFRVLVVGFLAWIATRVFGWRPLPAGIFATILGALIFSAFHYVGPYGDPLELPSFTFRTVAGVLFSAMYLTRGLGITAWTHALYDVFLTVM